MSNARDSINVVLRRPAASFFVCLFSSPPLSCEACCPVSIWNWSFLVIDLAPPPHLLCSSRPGESTQSFAALIGLRKQPPRWSTASLPPSLFAFFPAFGPPFTPLCEPFPPPTKAQVTTSYCINSGKILQNYQCVQVPHRLCLSSVASPSPPHLSQVSSHAAHHDTTPPSTTANMSRMVSVLVIFYHSTGTWEKSEGALLQMCYGRRTRACQFFFCSLLKETTLPGASTHLHTMPLFHPPPSFSHNLEGVRLIANQSSYRLTCLGGSTRRPLVVTVK